MEGNKMAHFAVINGDKVINRIVSESKDAAEETTGYTCIEVASNTHFEIDWNYIDGEFVAPVEQENV
jgi:hypothetical protein